MIIHVFAHQVGSTFIQTLFQTEESLLNFLVIQLWLPLLSGKNKWGEGKKHWSNKTAKLTNEIRICHTHNHGSGAGRCVLRKLAHMKISLLFCAKFQGPFFYLDLYSFVSFWEGRNSIVWSPKLLCSEMLAAWVIFLIKLHLDHCS